MYCVEKGRAGYSVISVCGDWEQESDPSVLVAQVERILDKGIKGIALLLPQTTYPSSACIAAVIWCAELVRNAGGTFALVCSSPEFDKAFVGLSLNEMMIFAETLEVLPSISS